MQTIIKYTATHGVRLTCATSNIFISSIWNQTHLFCIFGGFYAENYHDDMNLMANDSYRIQILFTHTLNELFSFVHM